ncbi:MAG: zinc-dependent alcohol dehydrogenase family protein [Candidatus Aenigmarchaeota archaeon]|nr:zinc-dependent alcohol dehydrogenase family protein [Candidatus Aenigmarchaeota archaeon]
MKAQVLKKITSLDENPEPLELVDLPVPKPKQKEILIKVSTCGVCRTELDEIEGRVQPKLPIILGHEVVGRVKKLGPGATKFKEGDRVGIAWINSACEECYQCRRGNENLCKQFQGTGCHANGGYAEYTVVKEDFAYLIPERFSDLEAAPLLCAGAIGYRALKLTGMEDGETLALYGFGASNHLVFQVARYLYRNSKIFVFTRVRGDVHSKLAEKMGADWVGETGDKPPEKYNRAIDTTPVGGVIRAALENLEDGGRLIINNIRKETLIPELDYTKHLWYEKEVKSVTNITRKDVQEFLPLAAEIPITPEITEFKLEEANKALISLKQGKYRGAGVLSIADSSQYQSINYR